MNLPIQSGGVRRNPAGMRKVGLVPAGGLMPSQTKTYEPKSTPGVPFLMRKFCWGQQTGEIEGPFQWAYSCETCRWFRLELQCTPEPNGQLSCRQVWIPASDAFETCSINVSQIPF